MIRRLLCIPAVLFGCLFLAPAPVAAQTYPNLHVNNLIADGTITGNVSSSTVTSPFGNVATLSKWLSQVSVFCTAFNAHCDGVTDDSASVTAMVNAANLSATPMDVLVPSTVLISGQNWTITGQLSLYGANGGGFKLAAGSTVNHPGLFKWTTASTTSQVIVKDLTIDTNGATVPNGSSSQNVGSFLNYFGSGNFRAEHVRIVNVAPPTGTYSSVEGIMVQSFNERAELLDDYVQFSAASNWPNQCINAGGGADIHSLITARGNKCLNSGINFPSPTGSVLVLGNDIDGFGFGAGIGYSKQPYASDTTPRQSVIANNSITNSLTTPDNTGDYIGCIESGYNGTKIIGNKCYNVSAQGIRLWGQATVENNWIADIGTGNYPNVYNACVQIINPSYQPTGGNGSVIKGNTCSDDGLIVGTHTSYIYAETVSTTGVQLIHNTGLGAVANQYFILGTGEQVADSNAIATFNFGLGSTFSGTNSDVGAAGNSVAISGSTDSFAIGLNNTVTNATKSIVIGANNSANTTTNAFVVGNSSAATGFNTLIQGLYGTDRGQSGRSVWANGDIAAVGDAQSAKGILRGTGAGTSAIRLTSNGAAAGGINCFNIPSNTAYGLEVTVLAFDKTNTAKGMLWPSWNMMLSRVPLTLTQAAQPTPITMGTVTGAALAITADATNFCLNVSFTPPTSNTDTWDVVAVVKSVEAQ